jgi:uncharacterized protein YqhQ
MNKGLRSGNPMQVGGQAVLEGVMMRAPGMVATAVRRPDGQIIVKREPYVSLADKNRLFKLPVLRGAAVVIEMLLIGIRTLNFSAEVAMMNAGIPGPTDGNGQNGKHSSSGKNAKEYMVLGITFALALIAGVVLFFVGPLVVTTRFFRIEQDPFWFNFIAGGIRIALLLLYLLIISRIKDVARVFQYHGAEHKAVFAFERGERLDLEATAEQSRFHPRCGTSFLLIVMVVAILLFSVVDVLLIRVLGEIHLTARLLIHLPLIPVVGGIAYEFIKASARQSTTVWGRAIVAPGLWLQRMTTKEPDSAQIEVALVALRSALGTDIALKSDEKREVYEFSLN